MNFKCPGQDDRNLKVETIKCAKCGYKVEIFSDEIQHSCPKCKSKVTREKMPSCIDWCKYAKECIGEEKYKRLKSGK